MLNSSGDINDQEQEYINERRKQEQRITDPEQVTDREGILIEGYEDKVEDKVRILNPRPEQPAAGEIIGKTKDDFYGVRGGFVDAKGDKRAVIVR